MKRFLFTLFLIFPYHFLFAIDETAMMQSVLKLKVYERESISGNYTFISWGSAVVIDEKKILTNAHVILDSENKDPTGYYEVCRFDKNKTEPVCFTTAKLISYDAVDDLAILEMAKPTNTKKLQFSEKKLDIGSSMIVYWYPAIGGTNITRTEWKVWGKEGERYKFDGTIDHGNSWWWAFDSEGRLVGMPNTVSSDNWVIGYIIPISKIRNFLDGKSYSRENFASPKTTEFIRYISDIQGLFSSPNNLKTPFLEMKSMEKAGFILRSAAASLDWKTFDYRWSDKNKRVTFFIQCTRDGWIKSAIEMVPEDIDNKDVNRAYYYTWYFLDKNLYILQAIPNKESAGEKIIDTTLLYKNAPTCSVGIVANDGLKKDKKLYEKAIEIGKTVKFLKPLTLSSSFSSSFFEVDNISSGVLVYEWPSSQFGDMTTWIKFQLWKDYTTSSFTEINKYESLDDYMNMWYSEENYYKGNDYSFQSFYERYRTVGDPSILEEFIIESKNKKQMILSVINRAYKSNVPDKEDIRVLIFYPFTDKEWKLRSYTWRFDIASKDYTYVQQVRRFFESLSLPGEKVFSR